MMLAPHRWLDVVHELQRHPPGTRLRIRKSLVEHPRDAGLRPSIGLPAGQRADYRLALQPGCSGIHVQDFGEHYEVHLDQKDPGCDAIGHLQQDAPGTFVATAALAGGLIGLLLGRTGQAFAVGAIAGSVVGCLGLPDRDSAGRPAPS